MERILTCHSEVFFISAYFANSSVHMNGILHFCVLQFLRCEQNHEETSEIPETALAAAEITLFFRIKGHYFWILSRIWAAMVMTNI